MQERICNSCGGELSRNGNYYCCDFCGNRWEIDVSNDVHAVDRANAWSALRDGDFEKAARLFEEIILKDSKSHEAYWGRALACASIVYVTDMNENKKVPTCNNITEDSFINNQDVQKAISLAPKDIREGYQAQARQIEGIRVEWLQKASKEPAYDVFISFKDSDRENGIERTQDSIDAQDLYNALVAEGYKVFFSRISLRDKISEQYEPYIYNAIKTAKVMIVFGEKPEYFSSVWIKNEWSRFKTRIEKGEKHKNSLVVVYKNMNPGDLPVVLKSRQCLNAAEMTFLPDLNKHIRRVITETQGSARLDRIKIEGGKVSKKADRVAVNTIKTREIGEGAQAETDLSNQQFLALTKSYLQAKQWSEAGKLIDEMLFNNPADYNAIWCQLLMLTQATNKNEFAQKLGSFKHYDVLEKLLNTASKDFASEVLVLLYSCVDQVTDETYVRILHLILPFNFPDRENQIQAAFDAVVSAHNYQSFLALMDTVEAQDVDGYIRHNLLYASKSKDQEQTNQCLDRILSVDQGHVEALTIRLQTLLSDGANSDQTIPALETLLKYAKNPQNTLIETIRYSMKHQGNTAFIKQALRYHEGELSAIQSLLWDIVNTMLQEKQFQDAEYYCNLILSLDKANANNPKLFWMLCLAKAQVSSEIDLHKSDYFLTDIPEFNKYLAMVDEHRRKHCIALVQKQKDQLPVRIKALQAENRQLRACRPAQNSGCFKWVMIYGWIATSLSALCLFIKPLVAILNLLLGIDALLVYYLPLSKAKKEWKQSAAQRRQKADENDDRIAILRLQQKGQTITKSLIEATLQEQRVRNKKKERNGKILTVSIVLTVLLAICGIVSSVISAGQNSLDAVTSITEAYLTLLLSCCVPVAVTMVSLILSSKLGKRPKVLDIIAYVLSGIGVVGCALVSVLHLTSDPQKLSYACVLIAAAVVHLVSLIALFLTKNE